MKTFILYNESRTESKRNALICLKSFKNFSSWDPELYNGFLPKDLPDLESRYNFSNNRSRYQPKESSYKSKKACFFSHFHLWLKCVELNIPISIVEHDTLCIADLPSNFIFEGIIQYSAESIFNSFKRYKKAKIIYDDLNEGTYSFDIIPPLEKWGQCIAGNTAYGITPYAAKILIDDCYSNGWQQNDLLMNTKLCNIEFTVPSYIFYNEKLELRSSSLKLE